ncbi:MAG: cysteine--tRNA ligase [Candidatus Saccharimonadales bacterium]
MQLYNTLTRKLDHFEPTNPPDVSLYTCGPTVYNYLHIGNWAAYVRWDMLVRVLRDNNYAVDWVMNVTDVGHLTGENEGDADQGEDKLEKGARREGKTAWEIADFYTKDFLESINALNIQKPTQVVRATDHIAEQIDLIKKLEEKGFTYVIDDGVYFDTSKLTDYGKLARLKTEDLKAGARVEYNQQKNNPTDFALWKFSPKDKQRDMEWDSPWGKGFPGWHLECSAMAMKYLGETLDIHAGGIDHIPVHHTNEIAQSEGATGKPFARFWLHSNFINVENTKISKSLGNDITLHQVVDKGFHPLDLRMLYLQSHYRSAANFTWGGLEAARQRRLNLQAFADLRFQLKEGGELDDNSFAEVQNVVRTELRNDLHTPEALAALSDLTAAAEDNLIAPESNQAFEAFLRYLDGMFGLQLLDSRDTSSDVKDRITKREVARANRDFQTSDTIRDELAKEGIGLRDTPLGTIWYRTKI